MFFLFCCAFLKAQTPKVLIIGIDGTRADALEYANTPNIDDLISNGSYSYDALNDDITSSGPGWSAMLTGVWSNKHGVIDNSFNGQNYANYPHFFKRVFDHDPALIKASICHWSPINDQIVGTHADYKLNVGSDLAVANEAASYLANNDPDVLFLHFDDVDGAGHGHGYGINVPQYIAAIETTDTHVGTVITALEARSNYANENWLILSSTDHGGLGFSHGGNSIDEENIFLIASGDSIPNQEIFKDSIIQGPPLDCLSDSIHLVFDGNNDYVEIPSDPIFDFGTSQDFTFECRVLTSTAGDVAIVGNKDWDSGGLPGFVFSFKFPSGPEWKVNIGDGTNRVDINTGGNIANNEWYTLSVSFDRDGFMKTYQDGLLLDSASIASIGNINTTGILRFGTDTDGEYDYSGNISEVRVWDKVISKAEIDTWHCQHVTNSHPDYSNLIGYWKMNDGGNSTTVIDASVNGNDGMINGATWQEPMDIISYDYDLTPRITDVALSALSHLCIPIDPVWDLDGTPIFSTCPIFLDECSEDTLQIPFLKQDLYHAHDIINSKALVEKANIDYMAGDKIELESNFEVKANCNFSAIIDDCNN